MKLPVAIIVGLLTIAAIVVPSGPALTDSPAVFQARLVSGGLKVFLNSAPSEIPDTTPFGITAVRNEYTPFQVAISVLGGRSSFSVAFSRLTSPKGTIEVPPGSLLLVENVLVKNPSIPAPDGKKNRTGRLWPDPLPPLKVFEAKEGETRAVWIDLFVPPSAEPGLYRGSVDVSSAEGSRAALPIEVDVRPVTLPAASSLRTAFGNSSLPSCIEKAHRVARDTREYQKLIEDYYWFLVDHRLSPYHIPVSIYSDEAHRFLDDPRVTSFVVPVGWGSNKSNPIWDDTEMNRLSERLKQTGWITKGLFYVIDEPEEDAFADVVKVGKRIHTINPQFRYLLTPSSGKILGRRDIVNDASVDIWVPLLRVMSRGEERKALLEEQKKGKELWWYTCVVPKWPGMNYFIDEAATAPRLHPWMNYLYGNTGVLYWATDNWTHVGCDPWLETETFPTGNGDGSLLYPGRDFPGPVASIRLKMLREGLEEYDLLALLGKRLREAADMIGGPAVNYEPADRLFEHALALVTEDGRDPGPKGEPPYLTHVTRDYWEVETRRNLVIEEIEQVLESPIFLVTTSPRDGEVTDKTQVFIRGFAGNETAIRVNGVPAPVNERAFQTSLRLESGRNELTVRATDNHGKSRTRHVMIIRK
jgi:hypothetical protein